MSITLYGLKNCDSCKKAQKYIEGKGGEAVLVDVRENPPTKTQLKQWCASFGRGALVNKRSTTWRGLSDVDKDIQSDAQAIELIIASPALMKRPVIISGQHALLGFNANDIDSLV